MNKIQEMILNARAHVEATFGDPALSTETLAEQARIHAMLTQTIFEADGWSKHQPEEPKLIKVKAKTPRKRYPSDEKRKTTTKPFSEIKHKKDAPKAVKGTQPRHVNARQVVCPKCFALSGDPCWKMTLGKNNKPTKQKTAGGVSHPERIESYAKWSINEFVQMQNSTQLKQQEIENRAVDAIETAFPGSTVVEPDPVVQDIVQKLYGTPDGELTDDEILAALGERTS